MIFNREDLEDLIIGLSFFGCGGGGSREEGFEVIKDIDGVEIIDLDELDDEAMIASPYTCGSLESEVVNKVFKELKATLELQNFLNTRFAGLFPTELGGYNTAIVFKVAKKMDIPVIDGDGAGRAVPEIHHSIPSIMGYRAVPSSTVFATGDTLIIKETESDEKLESIVRCLVSRFGNVGVCDHPMKVKDAKKSLVRNSLTKSLEVGKLIKRRDLDSLLEITGSTLLKTGKIQKVERNPSEGFTEGRVWIDSCVLHFKNENMILECEGKTYEFPDLIILLRVEDLLPVENPPCEGEEVYVLISKADERWYNIEEGVKW